MPLFLYVCDECGAENELLIRGKETPVCPACGSAKLVKQASAFAPVAGGSPACGDAPAACGASQRCCDTGSCPYS